jgi:mannose/cellobiose epimerase-like protein (N-acyl-D-glucosamine 2-epimerase family)
MHLLEAALAWIETDGGDVWRELATDIVSLALRAFIDPDSGALREFFNADWSPAPGEEGRLLEPGHQFEWAWLMQRWALMTNSQAAHEAAKGLFAAGLKGVDPKRSVAIDELNDDFSTRSARARLWPQTEYIKAALILAKDAPAESVESLLGRAAQGAEGLWRYLETPIPGLWRDKLLPNNQFVSEPAPASSLYHIVGAIVALTDWRRGG